MRRNGKKSVPLAPVDEEPADEETKGDAEKA